MATNFLDVVDYVVVVGTLLLSISVGLYFAVKNKSANKDDLLVGSRKMKKLPVAASMVVTSLNAITILGYPAEIYSYGSQMYMLTPVGTVTGIFGVFMFAKVLYPLKLTSAYTYMEGRFHSSSVRMVSSFIYLLQLLMGTGIVVYAPAIALETIIGVPFWISIVGMVICGTIYTSIGGLNAVVWTDAFQFVMIFIGMIAIVVKAVSEAGGLSKAWSIAGERGRLELINWSVDPFMRHNTLNILLGAGFTGFFGAVTPTSVQRYCSLPTFRGAVESFIWSFILQAIMITLVVFTGVLMFAVYADCDPLTTGDIKSSDQIVPYFVVNELDVIPGLVGLFTAVIFSAVLSTISSVLNTLAALTWEDFLIRFQYFKDMSDRQQSWTYKILSILYGGIIVVLAYYANNLGPVVQAAVMVAGVAIGVQGSVFFCGMFFPFVNGIGVSIGMIVGVALMGYYSVYSFELQKKYSFQKPLDFSTEGCSNASTDIFSLGLRIENETSTSDPEFPSSNELDWPKKLFTMSYVLYSLIGGVITISVSVIVSLLTGGAKQAKFVQPEYLHPLVRPKPSENENVKMAEVESAMTETSKDAQGQYGSFSDVELIPENEERSHV